MQAAELNWIERFVAQLKLERRASPHTAASYRRDLVALIHFCDRHSLASWTQLDSQHVRSFAAAQHGAGMAPRSIQRQLSAVRSFYAFLGREGASRRNPAVGVQAPKIKKRLPVTLDADQMARLLEFRAATTLDARDKAIMELFYSSGLRLAELVSLDLPDLDIADGTVRVLGKGNKTRIVPVGRQAIAAVKTWLGERSALVREGCPALFIGRHGARLGVRAVQSRVDAWARRQGIGVRVHPHMFRHSFASHLLESSGDLRGVQELLGHSDISTTQVYTHLDFQHLARVYDAAHPRARRRRHDA
jgi:integrase/recombinase XerC